MDYVAIVETNEAVLEHHGRLGQKWGKKNGPPYPLNYDDLSDEERAKAKDEAISTGNTKEAYNNRKYFSNEEIARLLVRYDTEHRLLEKVPKEDIRTGLDKFEEAAEKISRVGKAVNKGIDAYNPIAKVLNSVVGTDLPLISDNAKKIALETEKARVDLQKAKAELAKSKEQTKSIAATTSKTKAEAKSIDATTSKAKAEAKRINIENNINNKNAKAQAKRDDKAFKTDEKLKVQKYQDSREDSKLDREFKQLNANLDRENKKLQQQLDREQKSYEAKQERDFKKSENQASRTLTMELANRTVSYKDDTVSTGKDWYEDMLNNLYK